MTLNDDVSKLFDNKHPATRIGYKILKTKVLDAIGKTLKL